MNTLNEINTNNMNKSEATVSHMTSTSYHYAIQSALYSFLKLFHVIHVTSHLRALALLTFIYLMFEISERIMFCYLCIVKAFQQYNFCYYVNILKDKDFLNKRQYEEG